MTGIQFVEQLIRRSGLAVHEVVRPLLVFLAEHGRTVPAYLQPLLG